MGIATTIGLDIAKSVFQVHGGFRLAADASIIASAKRCTIALATDRDVLDLAARTHAVFPTIPYLWIWLGCALAYAIVVAAAAMAAQA